MTARDVVTGALLTVGVGAELLCCIGVLLMRNAIDRLHYAAAGATVGPVLVAAAVVAEESVSAAGITALLVAITLVALNSVVTTATARVVRGMDP